MRVSQDTEPQEQLQGVLDAAEEKVFCVALIRWTASRRLADASSRIGSLSAMHSTYRSVAGFHPERASVSVLVEEHPGRSGVELDLGCAIRTASEEARKGL